MAWEDILKVDAIMGLRRLVGKDGKLEDIMEMIDKEFGVKSELISSSSSQPVIGFNLPIYVRCEMGTKGRPSTTEEFTIKNVGVNKTR